MFFRIFYIFILLFVLLLNAVFILAEYNCFQKKKRKEETHPFYAGNFSTAPRSPRIFACHFTRLIIIQHICKQHGKQNLPRKQPAKQPAVSNTNTTMGLQRNTVTNSHSKGYCLVKDIFNEGEINAFKNICHCNSGSLSFNDFPGVYVYLRCAYLG